MLMPENINLLTALCRKSIVSWAEYFELLGLFVKKKKISAIGFNTNSNWWQIVNYIDPFLFLAASYTMLALISYCVTQAAILPLVEF